MMLLISSFSLPLAVSKLVSARLAAGQAKSAYKIFRCTLVFALVSGGIASLLVYFGAGFFSDVLVNITQTEYKVISRITEELMIEADDLLILFGKMELLNKIANI